MTRVFAAPHPWIVKLQAEARARDDLVLPLIREGLTQAQVAARTGLTPRGVKAAVLRLRCRGLIPSKHHPANDRLKAARDVVQGEVLRLTLAGKTALATAREIGRNEEAVKRMRRDLRLEGRLP